MQELFLDFCFVFQSIFYRNNSQTLYTHDDSLGTTKFKSLFAILLLLLCLHNTHSIGHNSSQVQVHKILVFDYANDQNFQITSIVGADESHYTTLFFLFCLVMNSLFTIQCRMQQFAFEQLYFFVYFIHLYLAMAIFTIILIHHSSIFVVATNG